MYLVTYYSTPALTANAAIHSLFSCSLQVLSIRLPYSLELV